MDSVPFSTTIYVCEECNWKIFAQYAVEDQGCEAWVHDPYVSEHGPCRRVVVWARDDVLAALNAWWDTDGPETLFDYLRRAFGEDGT